MSRQQALAAARQRPDRANELMEAALRQFARQDFNSVTIKDIANSIPVNSALIYYYFENKEALFRASLAHAADLALARYDEMCEGASDPVALIEAWFDNHFESVELIRYMVKVMLDFAATHPQRDMIETGVQSFYGKERELLSRSIRAGIQAGRFREVDAEAAAQVASTMLDGVMVRSHIQSDFDLRGAIGELKVVFWSYLGYRP